MWIVLLFLALPFIEIALFILVGDWIGLLPTLGLVVLSILVGTAVVRAQGAQALRRLQAAVASNGDPSAPLAHGALIAAAGVLLIMPGFFTDFLGVLLLIPPVRAALIRAAAGRVRNRTVVFTTGGDPRARPRDYPAEPRGEVRGEAIEGDYEVLDDVPPSQRGASGWTRPQS
jgi:UPF0716 protein FxsA